MDEHVITSSCGIIPATTLVLIRKHHVSRSSPVQDTSATFSSPTHKSLAVPTFFGEICPRVSCGANFPS